MNEVHRLLASRDAEQSVLGAILITAGEALHQVTDLLMPEDFFYQDHRKIFSAMLELDRKHQPIDVVTVSGCLEEQGDLIEIGGLAYLGNIAKETPSAANIEAYGGVVKDRHRKRQTNQISHELGQAIVTNEDTLEVLSDYTQKLMDLAVNDTRLGVVRVGEGVSDWIDRVDASTREEFGGATPTGYVDLDQKMAGGLRPGEFTVIAARPSMGKSALALNLAMHIGGDQQKPVAIFSPEMTREDLMDRMVAAWAGVDMQNIRLGELDDQDWNLINTAITKISAARIFIEDAGVITVQQLRAEAIKLKHQQHGIGLVICDYMQLMTSHEDTRVQQLSEISRGLKLLAKDLDCPVIGISQLNRDVEKRDNKRPRMSDIKESGSIEQDADVILFVYRDAVYNEHTQHPGVAEIILAKQRSGPTGTVLLTFEGRCVRFRSMDQGSQQTFWDSRLANYDRSKRGLRRTGSTAADHRAPGGD